MKQSKERKSSTEAVRGLHPRTKKGRAKRGLYEPDLYCKYCEGDCVRSGYSSCGVQRYCCKSCGRHQQGSYNYKACERNIENNIAVLNNESSGIRNIARILKISAVTVIKKIRNLRKKIQKPIIAKHREYELDEMRTYVGNKKRKYWVVYAIDRATRSVVDFRVGKRNNNTLRAVVDTLLLSEAKGIYTDGLVNYEHLIPKEVHKKGKRRINYIERKNLSIRTHLKRMSRKTICFSRSVSMLEAVLGIYFWRNSYSFVWERAGGRRPSRRIWPRKRPGWARSGWQG